MAGYTFRPINIVKKDGIPGLQIGFNNDYGVNIIPDSYSEDKRFMHSTMTVKIVKDIPASNWYVENKTLDVMQKLGYFPSTEEAENLCFIGVTPNTLVTILLITKEMEIH